MNKNSVSVSSKKQEIENFKAILKALTNHDNELKMSDWHIGETTHCLHVWHSHLTARN